MGASGGSNGGGLSGGGDAVAAFSYNFILDLPEPEPCVPPVEKYSRPQEPLAGPALTVAVFDTGLLGNLKTTYTQNVDSCMPGGNLGWNFAYKNKDTEDDHPSTHGSAVTQFIMDQQAQYRLQKINLLPVKVHNNLGKSDLFSILCGFAYAANCGAKIINASFGFYAAKNSGPSGYTRRICKAYFKQEQHFADSGGGQCQRR